MAVKVFVQGLLDLFRSLPVSASSFSITAEGGEIFGCLQPGICRGYCKSVDTPVFLPQVVRRKGKPCLSVPVRCKEVRAPDYHLLVLTYAELYVLELLEMKPQSPQHKPRPIFLDREMLLVAYPAITANPKRYLFCLQVRLFLGVAYPRMPRTPQ